MKKRNIAQYPADELPETTKTDWKRLAVMSDEEIDTSEIPGLDQEWFKTSEVVLPIKRRPSNST